MLKAVLFDLDGTLVDSMEASVVGMQATMKHFGLSLPTREDIIPLQGLHVREFFPRLQPHISPEQALAMFEHYKQSSLEFYDKIVLIEHSLTVLTALQKKYQLGLVTSRGKAGVKILFKQYDLWQYFKVIVDREDVTQHKPHPQGLEIALTQLKLQTDEAIYVGDAIHDVLTAHNAGMKCILISKDKDTFGADYHLSDIKHLPALIKTLS